MKLRREIINTLRGPLSETGAITVIQTLECGHEMRFVGTAAVKARTAERRQCDQCPEIDNSNRKRSRQRQSRAGNGYNLI